MLSWHQSKSIQIIGKQMNDFDWRQLNMHNSTHFVDG